MSHEWGPGRVVAGKYRLVEKLGEGGMGAVWRADHVTLGSPVAVKLVNQSVLDSEDGVARFLNEARAAALLRSPHVVQILDHGLDDDVPFMVMELLEGESLAGRLARVGTLPLVEAARLVTQVARAITKAHEAGIVHRDLKPDNIFLVRNDDEEVAKVLDFGIAKMTHGLAESAQKLSTRTGALLGTPYYMSPEQVRGHSIDWRTDLWALAVITYECVTGRVPFNGATVGDLLLTICTEPLPPPPAGLPAAFDAWFRKAVARPREERFQSAREMAEALRAVAAETVEAPRLSSGDAASAQARGNADTLVATPPSMDLAPTLDGRSTPDPERQRGDESVKLETMAGASVAPMTARETPRRRTVMAVAIAGAAALAIALAMSRTAPQRPIDARSGATTAIAPIIASVRLAEPPKPTAQPVTNTPSIEPAGTATAAPSSTPSAAPTTAPDAPTAHATATAASSAAKPPRTAPIAPPKATATAQVSAPPPPAPKKDPLAF